LLYMCVKYILTFIFEIMHLTQGMHACYASFRG
jgi:hypothetical protein